MMGYTGSMRTVDQVLTVGEAAAELGIKPATLRFRLETGLMDGRKAGGGIWLIDRDELARQGPGLLARGPKKKTDSNNLNAHPDH
jgi:hypothetical protein